MLPPSCHRLEYGASSKCLLQNLQLYKFGKESLEAKDNGSLLAYFSKFNLSYAVWGFQAVRTAVAAIQNIIKTVENSTVKMFAGGLSFISLEKWNNIN